MLRELVLSSTYGQSQIATPALVARDPGNRLLARGPRVRLTAEMVRDQALAAAGLPQGRNTPGELPRIAQEAARLRDLPLEQLAQATRANALQALPRLAALAV